MTDKFRWTLPSEVYPTKYRCYLVRVPDERFYVGAFLGAIYNLTLSNNWQRDPTHAAALVSRVWTDIFDALLAGACEVPPNTDGQEFDGEELMASLCESLRFSNGVLQAWCCGEWVDIAGQPAQGIGGGPQPGGGSPQPQPGGGAVTYDGCLNANELWLLPTPLSTGDTIELLTPTGAATGNGGTTWNCPNGDVYFAGGCLAIGATVGTDPLPTAQHMALILQLDGDYYDLSAGPVTVPSGVSNVQGWIQVNDDDLTDNSGTECFNVDVTNNQVGTFVHDFNFTLNIQGWTVRDIGQYVVGQGFEAVYSAPIMTADIQSPVVSAFTLTRMVVTVDNSGQSGGSNIAFGKNTPGVYFYNVTNNNGHQVYDTGVISETAVTRLFVDAFLDTSLATGIIRSIHLEGEGPDPF